MAESHDPEASKILKIMTKNDLDELRKPLEEYGPVQYLERHYIQDTIIVYFKFKKDSEEAYQNLKENQIEGLDIQSVEYVQKTIKSDEVDKVWGS